MANWSQHRPSQMNTTPPLEHSKEKSLRNTIKDGLHKSSSRIVNVLSNLFGKGEPSTHLLDELEDALISADLGVKAASQIINKVKQEYDLKNMSYANFLQACSAEIQNLMKPSQQSLTINPELKPFTILMVGVNGSGKTSSIGKLTNLLKQSGKKVSLVAADTFRAAAVKQLQVWGERNNVRVFTGTDGSDPASLVFDSMNSSKAQKDDVLLIDTAGRLQNKANLMDELSKIIRVIKKQDITAPHATLLVLDATVGQNAISQITGFCDAADVTGLILTKLDGTAKGGVIISLCSQFSLPLHYIGVGEGIADLKEFNAKEFADSLLGIS